MAGRHSAPRHVRAAEPIDDPPRKKHWFRRIFLTLLVLGLLGLGAFALAVFLTPIPDPNEVAASEATVVYWADGETEIGRLGDATRRSVALDDIPIDVQHAVLAAEDRDFYEHGGFSPVGIGRAVWNNLRGGSLQGGSTITQQYAKNAYLSSERSFTRKAKELILAVKLDQTVSKEDILEDYLNTIYFGRGAYGIEAASLAYFGTSVSNLDYQQGAMLASLIKAPSALDPAVDKKGLKARWKYVLDTMAQEGWLSEKQRAGATFPDVIKPRTSNRLGGQVGYLLEAVQADLRHRVDDVAPAGLELLAVVGIEARRLDERGKHRALLVVELGHRHTEVGERSGLDAIRAAAEVDGVEVVAENLVLAHGRLELDAEDELARLADEGALRREVGVLGVLLRDRRAALQRPPGHVVVDRPANAHRREAAVVVELPVLRGEHGALHIEGYVGQRDTAPRGVAEAADLGSAVGVVDDRRLGARDLIGIRDGGEEDRGSERSGTEQAQHQQREESAADPAPLATRLLGL